MSAHPIDVAPSGGAAARRSLDLAVAGTAALVFAPVMLLVSLAIWIESGRPILFSQLRLGQGGRPFRMYKFRKFHKTCDASGSPLTLDGDARLTRIGRFLLITKLDELPQLWNVLRGDMSIVGPRPESLAFTDCYANGYERLLEHKPGILGPCQVLFRNENGLYPADRDPAQFYRQVLFPTKARIDLDYFPRRTLVSDMAWIGRGVLAVCGWVPSQGGVAVRVARERAGGSDDPPDPVVASLPPGRSGS